MLYWSVHETAAFSDDENVKLQEFADLCADIDSSSPLTWSGVPKLPKRNTADCRETTALPAQEMGKRDRKAL